MKSSGKFTKVTDKEEMEKYIMENHYGAKYYTGTDLGKNMEYVVSPGVCNGDYGGPLYYEMDENGTKHFIVTGVINFLYNCLQSRLYSY